MGRTCRAKYVSYNTLLKRLASVCVRENVDSSEHWAHNREKLGLKPVPHFNPSSEQKTTFAKRYGVDTTSLHANATQVKT